MRSIELHWLSKRDRTLPLPNLIYTKTFVGGYYCRPDPTREVYDDDGIPHDCRNGLIVISTEFEGDVATLAHEWRHHYQFYHGIELNSIGWINDDRSYKEKIIEYFLSSTSEMDAFRFQLSLAPPVEIEEWVEWLYPHVQDILPKTVYSF